MSLLLSPGEVDVMACTQSKTTIHPTGDKDQGAFLHHMTLVLNAV